MDESIIIVEYKITDALLLRFKKNRNSELGAHTTVVVNDKEISQCMFLMMNIPIDNVEKTHDYMNIDELGVKYSKGLETTSSEYDITPEQEFWGHCSNIQVWVENDYNPNLLHSNISVPLLTELAFTDVKVFHKLLYHLDDMWKLYKTKQRRTFVFNKYAPLIIKCLVHYKIELIDVYNTNAFLYAMKELIIITELNRIGGKIKFLMTKLWKKTDTFKVIIGFYRIGRKIKEITYKVCKRLEEKERRSFKRRHDYWERKIWGAGRENLKYRKWLRDLRNCNVDVVSPPEDYPAYMWSKHSDINEYGYKQWSELDNPKGDFESLSKSDKLQRLYYEEGIRYYYHLKYEFYIAAGQYHGYTVRKYLARYENGSFAVRTLIF